ncbi:MAG: outer membrane lipoprotein-sorting protein [Deltaproteobacteria bacterium]|nr:outer membrane lipoprotein-sorting protein [Deltaproteobacteria bacterium]
MKKLVQPIALALLLLPAAARGEAETCASILERSEDKLGMGVQSGKAVLELETHPRTGKPRQRSLEIQSMQEEGLLRTRVQILAPADVAGTAFLTLEREGKDDEQHMFLPALGKVRRISGSAKKGSFMGTDFSYADLETRDAEDNHCELVGEETLEGKKVWHLSTRPKTPDKDDAYSRAELWVQQETLVPVKIELFDRKEKLLKVLEVQKVEKRGERFVATESTMRNVQKETWTKMSLGEVDFSAEFPPETFTSRSLQRLAR